MKTLPISHSMLAEALASLIREKSVGMVDCDISAIYAVASTGEAFEINGLEVHLAPAKRPATAGSDTSGRFTPPAGRGKIRLAAVDGEVL